MALEIHTITVPDFASNFARTDRVFMGLLPIAYSVGSGAGSVVTAAVTFGGSPMPTGYTVFFGNVPTDVTTFVTSPTSNGFTLNVEPRTAALTVAAGTLTALIVA